MTYRPMSKFPGKERFSPDLVFQGQGVSFFYTYIRKNASTSFKKLFQKMHPGLCPGDVPSIGCMAGHAAVRDMSPDEIDQAFTYKVFVYRDPIDRVFSVYKNKLIQQEGAEDLLRRLRSVVKRDPGLLSFEDFVMEYVSLLDTDRWEEVDGHLYPQTWHLLPITYNKVIRMDELYTQMQDILPADWCDEIFLVPSNSTTSGSTELEFCDADTPAVYLQKKYRENKALPRLEHVLTPAAETRLKELYADDFLIEQWNGWATGEQPVTLWEADNTRQLLLRMERFKLECKALKRHNQELSEKLQQAGKEQQVQAEQLKQSAVEQDVLREQLKQSAVEQDVLREQLKQSAVEQDVLREQLKQSAGEQGALRERLHQEEKQLVEANRQVAALQSELGRSAGQLALKVAEVSRLRHSASFQAGYHVVRAGKSLGGLVRLPLALWRVARNSKRVHKPCAARTDKPQVKVPAAISAVKAVSTAPSQAAEISILGWPQCPENGKPRVLGIMDEFTTGCLEQDVNLILPRPDNWYALAERDKPDFIFIESAWKGNQGSWQYRVAEYANKPGQEVEQLCRYARERGIPTLFWNKEDPVHHDKFMCTAQLVEHIFTTDANMQESYRKKTGNTRVHVLPFAAQPALHRPASMAGRKARACFAGSWYGNRHAERGHAMHWLLQAANRHGLDIYDRNYGTGIFPYPDEFRDAIKGSLPYKELCEEYGRYRLFLNVNSVTESPTMFSRRVFEILASGTPVVSTWSQGIASIFSPDSVWMVHNEEEAEYAIKTLLTDDEQWRRRSLAGIREVFSKHTYAHRFNDVFARLGLDYRVELEPAMALLASAGTAEQLQRLARFAGSQTYAPFILVVECPQELTARVGQLPDRLCRVQPGQAIAWLAEHKEYPLAGWLDVDAVYGEHYLRDLANARLYAPDAQGWAKVQGLDVFDYGDVALQGSGVWDRELFVRELADKPVTTLVKERVYLADADEYTAARAD